MRVGYHSNLTEYLKNPTPKAGAIQIFVGRPISFWPTAIKNPEEVKKRIKELDGDKNVKCGYQRGETNIAKKPEIRKKISTSVRQSYKNDPELKNVRRRYIYARDEYFINSGHLKFKNSIGQSFRSDLEVKFSEFLIENNIPYEYERRYNLSNGKVKIVDFVLYNFILVEVTGYAYDKWRLLFQQKIKLLRESVDNPILILTYPDNLERISKETLFGHDMYMGNIYDESRIKSQIEFITTINKIKSYDYKKTI